jgi:hypothetical protein
LQSLLVLVPLILHSPLPVYYALLPSLALLSYKIANTYLVLWGFKENPLMQGVVRGRVSALIPSADGGFERGVGDSVGGGGVCVFLLGARTNRYVLPPLSPPTLSLHPRSQLTPTPTHSPLGLFSPNFSTLGKYFGAMIADLSRAPEKYGFLGSGTYENTSDRTTQPEVLYVMYFKSSEHLHAFSRGKAHQEGWDWWVRREKEGGLRDLAISHETYEVAEGAWENIYNNYAPSGFAATSHLIEEEGGVKRWASPLVKGGHKGLKSSAVRTGFVKGPIRGSSGRGEKA